MQAVPKYIFSLFTEINRYTCYEKSEQQNINKNVR